MASDPLTMSTDAEITRILVADGLREGYRKHCGKSFLVLGPTKWKMHIESGVFAQRR